MPPQDWYKIWTELSSSTREDILFEIANLRQGGYSFKRVEIELTKLYDLDNSFAHWILKYYKHIIEGL